MNGSLEQLLARLCSGDGAAADETFRHFEPYLRKVVRRNLTPALRARFDSADVVQSVWVRLIPGFREAGWRFADVNQLCAFLVKATHNRFLDRVRQNARSVALEQRLANLGPDQLPSDREPRPSQLAQKEELWQQILALCPPEHQELVRLKRDGLSLEEIARHTGLHRDSVRRVLRTLARQVAFRREPADAAPDHELGGASDGPAPRQP